MSEHMTWEQLMVIRSRVELATQGTWAMDDLDLANITYDDVVLVVHAREDILALLAEVDRLREENAAMRIVLQSLEHLADYMDRDATGERVESSLFITHCPLCRRLITGPGDLPGPRGHTTYCPVAKARAILAAQGEANA